MKLALKIGQSESVIFKYVLCVGMSKIFRKKIMVIDLAFFFFFFFPVVYPQGLHSSHLRKCLTV